MLSHSETHLMELYNVLVLALDSDYSMTNMYIVNAFMRETGTFWHIMIILMRDVGLIIFTYKPVNLQPKLPRFNTEPPAKSTCFVNFWTVRTGFLKPFPIPVWRFSAHALMRPQTGAERQILRPDRVTGSDQVTCHVTSRGTDTITSNTTTQKVDMKPYAIIPLQADSVVVPHWRRHTSQLPNSWLLTRHAELSHRARKTCRDYLE